MFKFTFKFTSRFLLKVITLVPFMLGSWNLVCCLPDLNLQLCAGVVGCGKGVMYLASLRPPTDIGLQLGKACYPCTGVKLAQKFREMWLLPPDKTGRSFIGWGRSQDSVNLSSYWKHDTSGLSSRFTLLSWELTKKETIFAVDLFILSQLNDSQKHRHEWGKCIISGVLDP